VFKITTAIEQQCNLLTITSQISAKSMWDLQNAYPLKMGQLPTLFALLLRITDCKND